MVYSNSPIEVVAGVQPDTDFTSQSTTHYVMSDKVRFVDGLPEKIGGWDTLSDTVRGCPRSVFGYLFNNNPNHIIGTHSNLYHLSAGNTLTNITPVKTTGTAINNAFSTFYGNLGSNPLATTSGSTTVTVTDTAHRLRSGNVVTFSGAVDTNGIPAANINTTHSVGNITTNTYDITVTTAATSTGTGGGTITRATRLITVDMANTFANGANVSITGASATVGGIPSSSINGIHRIQNPTPTSFDIQTATLATSSASSTGGAATVFSEMDAGLCSPTAGAGYGLGLYGVGLYGTSKTATTPTLPRIWSHDRFGSLVIMTAGNQTGLYSWNSSVSTLPELVTNAPTAINYAFTSNEIAVTLGASATGNRVQWSDQGNLTTWTETVENQAGQDDIEGAGTFISHASVRGVNLLFTNGQVYTMRYRGRPFVWEFKELDGARGLIAQNARVVVDGVAYWMADDNFYYWRGGNVEIIPSNTTTQTTLKEFVFDNLSDAQKSKIFCWYNERFNEIWWHYPSETSSEPDRVVRFNIRDLTWTPDTMDRTAGEYPNTVGAFPHLTDINGSIYRHEKGTDANSQALPFMLRTRYFNSGGHTVDLGGLIPDSIQTGNITLTLRAKRYPQTSAPSSSAAYTITPTTIKLSYRKTARFWQYEINGSAIGQSWRGGFWSEDVQRGTRR